MYSSEDDDEDEDDTGREKKEEKECLFSRRAPHFGSVNRIRAMPQQPSVIATWGDSSIVQVPPRTCMQAEGAFGLASWS